MGCSRWPRACRRCWPSKTIDNDLGLNYHGEPEEHSREAIPDPPGYRYTRLQLADPVSTSIRWLTT